MVLFALSCVGLLLFLWVSFGGTIPLNAQGYRIRVSFPNAAQLATQADVRIAGVTVGKVIDKSEDPEAGATVATLQINKKYAPIRQDARAILRQKTLLGETYVQITPGSLRTRAVCDGCMLARSQVVPAVQLDQIFDTFDPGTRRGFQVWQQELAKIVQGNDQNLNDVFGNLPGFLADFTDVLRVLDIQHAAVVKLVRDGGTTFNALSADPAALQSLITNGETTFATTAANQNALADVFHIFPTFLTEQRLTMARLKSFSLDADPVIRELIPVARDLGPTLAAVRALSPDLRRVFENLGPLITVSQTGLPATRDILNGLRPVLGALGPFLEQLNPILFWLEQHQQLTSDFISNGAYGLAAREAHDAGTGHYLRQFGPTGPETISLFTTKRDKNNRGNTYPNPLWLPGGNLGLPWTPGTAGIDFARGNIPAWDCTNATGGQHYQPIPANSTTSNPPGGGEQPCWVQPNLGGLIGQPGLKFPHLVAARYSSH